MSRSAKRKDSKDEGVCVLVRRGGRMTIEMGEIRMRVNMMVS